MISSVHLQPLSGNLCPSSNEEEPRGCHPRRASAAPQRSPGAGRHGQRGPPRRQHESWVASKNHSISYTEGLFLLFSPLYWQTQQSSSGAF